MSRNDEIERMAKLGLEVVRRMEAVDAVRVAAPTSIPLERPLNIRVTKRDGSTLRLEARSLPFDVFLFEELGGKPLQQAEALFQRGIERFVEQEVSRKWDKSLAGAQWIWD